MKRTLRVLSVITCGAMLSTAFAATVQKVNVFASPAFEEAFMNNPPSLVVNGSVVELNIYPQSVIDYHPGDLISIVDNQDNRALASCPVIKSEDSVSFLVDVVNPKSDNPQVVCKIIFQK